MKLSETARFEHRHPIREAERQADHLLLARYAPPAVIVNEQMDVIDRQPE